MTPGFMSVTPAKRSTCMKKLILLVIATLVIAVFYWLASPPDEPTDQPVGVDSNTENNTSGESSAEELIATYVESHNQKNLSAYFALVHPEILADLDTKERKFSTWINSAKPIVNHSFKVDPISQHKLDRLTNWWDFPQKTDPRNHDKFNSGQRWACCLGPVHQ
jgi:hypothetical protein